VAPPLPAEKPKNIPPGPAVILKLLLLAEPLTSETVLGIPLTTTVTAAPDAPETIQLGTVTPCAICRQAVVPAVTAWGFSSQDVTCVMVVALLRQGLTGAVTCEVGSAAVFGMLQVTVPDDTLTF